MNVGHVRISFCRLNERMIVHDSFWASGFAVNGLKPRSNAQMATVWEEQSRNSDDSEAESDKIKKLALEKWMGSLICKLIND